MSQLLNLPSNEQDEIDELNDETFGCDLANDWEDAHEKLASFVVPSDGQSIENIEEHSQSATSHVSNIESFLNLAHSSKRAPGQLIDDVFPQCEDIVKKSISNFILDDDLYDDDDDICPDFASYEYVQNESNNLKSTSKVDKKSINLESLRPPSPSILPFDDPFMSSVWRPLSPELNSQHLVSDSQVNFTPNELKILTLEELEKNLTLNGHNDSIGTSNNDISKTKAIRLEDLEAQLLDNKPKSETTTRSTPSNSFINSSDIKNNSNASQVPTYVPGKMPPNIMEIAAMSLAKMTLPSPPSVIPSANKIVPPPPGLGSKFNLPGTNSVETKSSVSAPHTYNSRLSTQKSPDSLQSQMAMANAMANALANLSKLPTVRPAPMPPMISAAEVKLSPSSTPLVLDPIVQQEQQRIISRIITPAQAQRFYPSHMNNFLNARNHDKFAGFMTQKEKDWLVKIFRLQCKVNDPYVEDYYEVNFKVKQAILDRRQNLAKQHNKNIDDVEIDSIIESETLIVLPELAKVEEDKPKYIQFDNTLGKIQVLNTKCPRKLLDINPEKTSVLKLDTSSSYLMIIERLYECLLNIEDEDKRMPILPERVIQVHREKRIQLCEKLFKGLVKPINNTNKDEGTYFILIKRNMPTLKRIDSEVDHEILNINKGLLLVYRSLFQLREESQLVVLLSTFVKGSNYLKFVLDAEKTSKNGYANMLLKALARIEQTRNLIYIAAAIDDFHVITHNKYGYRILATIFKQYQASNEKLLFIYFWKLFVQALIEQVSDYPELHLLCIDHFQYLAQL